MIADHVSDYKISDS